jgi:AcrR family transcriptional regulator
VSRGRGRPASPAALQTRQRIIDAALPCFAEHGFEATTNRVIAAKAGISTGPIYHYFESKAALYAAVYSSVQELVYARFEQAAAAAPGFTAKFGAVLDSAHQLNRDDPTLAVFVASCNVDLRRHPELDRLIGRPDRFAPGEFFDRLIDAGIEHGEITGRDRDQVTVLLRVIASGLTDAVSGDVTLHADAVEAVKLMLAGELIRPAPATR